MPSTFLPRSKWAASPFLGLQVDVFDENNVLGQWTGSGYGPAAPFTQTQVSIKALMLALAERLGLAAPARAVPYRGTVGAIYINPGAAGSNSGTLANPYTSWASAASAVAAAVAGTEILFAVGTTTTMGAVISTPTTGTQANPIVFGVYDPAAGGARLTGLGQGLAALDFTGQTQGINVQNGSNWVCIDGLEIFGTTTIGSIRFVGTTSNIQVLNCILRNSGTAGINFASATGVSNVVIEGNRIHSNTSDGIRYIQAADDTTTSIVYNSIYSNGNQGNIYIVDATNTYKFSGTIACNSLDLHSSGVGVYISNGGGSPKIYRNVARRHKIGVLVQTAAAAAADFSGLVIENNDCEDNSNFGIELVAAKSVSAPWAIRYNRLIRSGSIDGGVTAGPSNYGRGIETYGADSARGCTGGVIHGNYCAGAFNFMNNASEGCGIGIDNNTRNVRVFGNVCEDNEGNSIQINQAPYNAIYSNLCLNGNLNYRARTQPSTNNESEIFVSAGLRTMVFNNTCISRKAVNQRFGISEYLGGTNTGSVYTNNLIIGAAIAGIERNTGATGATENNNLFEDCPVPVVNAQLTPIAAGAGSTSVVKGSSGAVSPSYAPSAGGVCDGTGAAVDASAVSWSGRPLAVRTPIGALFPA